METQLTNADKKRLFVLMKDELSSKTHLNKKWKIYNGLCQLIFCLFADSIIRYDEYNYFDSYIRDNKPKFGSIHYDYIHYLKNPDSAYYWKKGAVKPRKRWLNAQIRKFS